MLKLNLCHKLMLGLTRPCGDLGFSGALNVKEVVDLSRKESNS